MPAIIPTPPLSGGFVENLNLVARQIRKTNDSIYEDINEYVDLSRRWANEVYQVEPDPVNYPNEFSSYSHSLDSLQQANNSLAQAQASAASAADSLASAEAADLTLGECQAELVLCQAEVVNCQTEVTNCQIELANCQAEVVNCQDQVVLAAAEAALSAASAIESSDFADESQLRAWEAEAEDMTAHSYAVEFPGNVIEYTSNGIGGFTTVTTTNFSSFYWSNESKLSSAGFQFKGTWDSVDCLLPPTPTPDPGESADGWMYIVGSVTGDTTLCPELTIGDWIVWSGDNGATDDPVIEGGWGLINWTFDWSAITNVPENVYNALSRSGGRMTGNLEFNNNIKVVMSTAGGTFYDILFIDGSNVMKIGQESIPTTANGPWSFTDTDADNVIVRELPASNEHATNKLYVDTHPIDGGTY